MTKKFGIIFISIGVVLILSALLLFVYNWEEDKSAGDTSEKMLAEIKSEIMAQFSESIYNEKESDNVINSELSYPEMPVVNVNGYDFIGYISVPDIGIELPVLNEWDYAKLNVAPCRHFGSVVTDDLVVAAHNYISHFAGLENVKKGAEVTFTNMKGEMISYRVTKVTVVDGESVDEVINSGHDLVLYTCTYEGTTRIVVFCDRI